MTATIAADHLTGQALVSGGVPSVTVLYNYPLPAIYDELYVRREHRVQSHSARREGPVLLFVGVVGVDRGLFLMLRTVAQLKTGWDLKARLRIVGKIRSVALRDRARELIDELGIAEQVEFPGYVPQDRLAPYYEDADLGFMAYNPQVCEYNIPTKMFEYMAAGLPIIGTRAPMTSYFMDTVDAGVLVDSLDPADYARAIHDLWQDPERRQQMARNGRAAFEERFSWASEEAKLLALYSRLLEG
jgi:glycosyltransferase involved in cell wall biosynthesis